MKNKAEISIGLIGFGKHARKVHLPCLESSDSCKLFGIASRFRDSIQKNTDYKLYNDYHELIKSPDIDAVIISTSNDLHGALTIEALNHGKHVLCEKPLSWKEEEIKEIERLSGSEKLILATGFMYRNHPLYEYIDKEILGNEPTEITTRFHYPPVSDENIRSIKSLGGGGLLDIGCYIIDLAEYLLKSSEFSINYWHEINSKNSCDVKGELVIRHGRNVLYGSYSQLMPRSQQLQLWTPESGIECSSPFLIPRMKKLQAKQLQTKGTSRENKSTPILFPPCNTYQIQLELFIKSILSGKLLAPLTSGITNAKILANLQQMIKY